MNVSSTFFPFVLAIFFLPSVALSQVTVGVAATQADAAEGGATGVFRLSRTGDSNAAPLRIDFLRNAGDTSCNSGSDCVFDQNIISVNATAFGFNIPAGSDFLDITLTALRDNLVEGPETVVLMIVENSSYTIGDSGSATVIIADDAPVVSVSAPDPEATEGGDTGHFLISRTGGDISSELRADFLRNAADTSCIGGSDCTYNQPVVSVNSTAFGFRIPAGNESLEVVLTALNDNAAEGSEDVSLSLVESNAYVFGDPTLATVSILDNPPVVSVSAPDPNATEGSDTGSFLISRTGGDINSELRADFLRNAGDTSCDGGSDCTFDQSIVSVNSTTFGFRVPAGQQSLSVNLTALADNSVEGPETVILSLVTNSSYLIGKPSEATVSIADNAPVVTVTAPDPNASEEGDPGLFVIARANGDLKSELRVDFARGAGPASCDSGTDCVFDIPVVSVNSTAFGFRVPAGQNTLEVMVLPALEFAEEGNEESVLEIVASGSYLIGNPSRAIVTIADTELMFLDNFESGMDAAKRCDSQALSMLKPERFIELGSTVVDLLNGSEWSVCPLGAGAYLQQSCAGLWMELNLSAAHQLYLLNDGLWGDNAGFSDWHLPDTLDMGGHSRRLRGCAVRREN